MDKNKTAVRILGHEYTVVGGDKPEHVQRIARYVGRKMEDLQMTSRLSPNHVAVLTAMNIADDLLRAQDENARLRRELAAFAAARADAAAHANAAARADAS